MEREPASFTEKILRFEEEDRERILRALELAEGAASAGAASILLDLGLDAGTVTAAVILGGFQDRPLPENIAGQFGRDTALLVNGAVKTGGISVSGKTIHEARNIRNMLFAMADDIRVILLKLAEKLHALRVSDSLPGEMQKALAQECLDIYAPLAGRLGISWIKDEMEDLSLKTLNREAYQQIKNIVAEKLARRREFLEEVQQALKDEIEPLGIKIEVQSRAKHFYSVYMKMRRRNKSAAEIHDLTGMRVICGSVENCYTLLGIIHRRWKPLGGCFKDYIAMPKSNGYQSLHTTVMFGARGDGLEAAAEDGRQMEIQIRTDEMHRVAENGVASHWLYKQGPSRRQVQPGELSVVSRLKDWKKGEQEGDDSTGSWLEEIKREILRDSIYVFTPQGKVIELPLGATPIDFAYHIHTAIGAHCIGAKANGSIIPLSSPLKNTQVVEILTSPLAHPHLNWLQLAKTSRARGKIRSWLEQNGESLSAEKKQAEKTKPVQENISGQAAPPGGGPLVQKVSGRADGILRVRVEDEKNLLIRFARCCNPVTGDSIIGYVSRGRGIIIHRVNCANIANIPEFEERKIETEWENSGTALVKRFRIEARFSSNLFSEIEGAVRKRQGHLLEGRLEKTASNRLAGFFVMQLEQAGDLKAVMKSIRGIPGIIGIQAVN
ncbi:MAG: HD domain-containing protein [Treponema sp.]|nr:HD domain-containing protein [Treponema sp.]